MAIFLQGKRKVKSILINVDGEVKKLASVITDKDGVPTKVCIFGEMWPCFVAVDYNRKSYRSRNGNEWEEVAVNGFDDTFSINAITYGNGRFVAVGNNAQSYYSLDGYTWVHMSGIGGTTNSNKISLNNVTYGDGRFVCCGSIPSSEGNNTTKKTYYSIDGETWVKMTGLPGTKKTVGGSGGTTTTITIEHNIFGVAYGEGRFVCVGASGTICYSRDGVNWTTASGQDTTVTYQAVAYGNDKFVCVGSSGKSYQSANGQTWSAVSGLNSSTTYSDVTFGDGRFVCVGSSGKSHYLTGTIWNSITGLLSSYQVGNNHSAYYYRVVYGEGRFVCVDTHGDYTYYCYSDDNTWHRDVGMGCVSPEICFTVDGGYGDA